MVPESEMNHSASSSWASKNCQVPRLLGDAGTEQSLEFLGERP